MNVCFVPKASIRRFSLSKIFSKIGEGKRVGTTLIEEWFNFKTRCIPCQLYLYVVNLYTLILKLASQFIYIDEGVNRCHTSNCSIGFLVSLTCVAAIIAEFVITFFFFLTV